MSTVHHDLAIEADVSPPVAVIAGIADDDTAVSLGVADYRHVPLEPAGTIRVRYSRSEPLQPRRW